MSNIILNSFIKEAIKTESVDLNSIVPRLIDKRTIRLLHAALGLSTEANEFLDAMKKWIFYGKELDLVNLKEELGDSNWYQAIAMDELGTNYEEILTTVIKKLRSRYKLDNGEKGFTENAAVDRDLITERVILELLVHQAEFGTDDGLVKILCQPKPGEYIVTSKTHILNCQKCISLLNQEYPLSKGLTWKEIKEKIEAEGVKDEDLVAYIDIDSFSSINAIKSRDDEKGEWCISD